MGLKGLCLTLLRRGLDISFINAKSILKIIVSFFLSGIGAYAYLSYAQMWQNMCNQLKQQGILKK